MEKVSIPSSEGAVTSVMLHLWRWKHWVCALVMAGASAAALDVSQGWASQGYSLIMDPHSSLVQQHSWRGFNTGAGETIKRSE